MDDKIKQAAAIFVILCVLFAGVASARPRSQDAASQVSSVPARQVENTGTIKGRVQKFVTRTPVAGIAVSIEGTDLKTTSDAAGAYAFPKVPVGFYVLTFQGAGYYEEKRTDVIVRSNRITFLNVDVWEARIIREDVQVSAAPFPAAPARAAGRTELGAEEIRRDSGSLGDLSRALYAVPGIVKADEEANDMIVRGGSPTENGFYIDNIFIPNINHFPQMGASGGNISMLNMDFVDGVKVFTGGFDASYGNRLSSIMDIAYREGNREKINGQVNWSAIGYGAQVEGPLSGGRGSWMISGSRSFLKLIADILDMDNPSDFGDVQGKLVYDLTARDTLSLLALGGYSRTVYDPAGREKFTAANAGLTWRHLWGEAGYSDTSISYSSLTGTENTYDLGTRSLREEYDYDQAWLSFRNVNHFTLSSDLGLTLGLETQQTRLRSFIDYIGRDKKIDGSSAAAFFTSTIQVFPSFSLSAGARLDRLPYTERIHVSPRLSFVWALSERLSVNGAFGRFYQPLPPFLIVQDPGNRSLKDLRADHFILGFSYLLSKDVLLKIEAYDKEYRDAPMAPINPYVFVLDDVNGDHARFGYTGRLTDEGQAWARGVELTLQKKLTKNLYGLVSLTYYRARYRDLMGVWRNRLFDNRFIIGLSGGYKPNKYWEFSGRWILSGNRAFTPVNVSTSTLYTWPVWNLDDIMSGHLNNYESLSLRVDRRFYFAKTNLVAFAGALNILDHDNELDRFWDIYGNRYESVKMWGLIPYFGLEFEF